MALGLATGLALALPGARAGQEAGREYILRGRIMDTNDNWLPDVRVALRRAGVSTQTDGNGLFELRLDAKQPLVADAAGGLEILQLEKPGFHGRTITIKDARYFTQPIQEKLEPNAAQADTPGFTALLPASHSIHGLLGKRGAEARSDVTVDELRQALEKVAARNDPATAEARFNAYVPKGGARLKAVFLISRHGIGTIDHPVLRRFADERGVGLVGVEGAPVQRGCYPLSLLDPQLQRLGGLTGHPELATVPVLTFGHSNGTGFATVYAAGRPERLIAWISYHSGYAWQLMLPGVEAAPGLVMHGHLDQWLQNGQELAVQKLRRERNAPVGMMLEANVGHGPVDTTATWEFIVAFCEAAMRTRLGADGRLRPVAISDGWLGGRYDRAVGGQQELPIARYDAFAGDRTIANWLPDAEFAATWQRYGRTHPRPAPRAGSAAPRPKPRPAP